MMTETRSPRFIGRERELAGLEDARKGLSRSRGAFVLIYGEAGIGKSRLLAQFLAETTAGRARHVYNTECLERAQQPLGPIRSLLRELIKALDLNALDITSLRALAQVVPEALPAAVVTANAGSTLEREPLFGALFSLIGGACAKRATVITVEDVHWADTSTFDFLHYIAHRMRTMRLLVVATFRSEALAVNEELLARLSPLLREPVVQKVDLEPFGVPEVRALIEATLDGARPISDDLVEDIQRRADGNPFFVEELVKDALVRSDDRQAASPLPLSIRSAVALRVQTLAGDDRNVIDHAAVLGQRFDPDVLALVLQRSVASIAPALKAARDLNLILTDARERLNCRFRHALTRQTIYEAIPAFERRRLHAEILIALESAGAEQHLDELAYHAWEAGSRPQALAYNERAGEAAFTLRALPEARLCFERAVSCATDDGDRARMYQRIGVLERLAGRYELARDAYEAAYALRLRRNEITDAALLCAGITGQRYNLDDQGALAFADRFLQDYGMHAADGARGHLLATCARIAIARYDFAAAQRYLAAMPAFETLSVSARHNVLIAKLMDYAYHGDRAGWESSAENVEALLPQLEPESVLSILSAMSLTGVFIGANNRIEHCARASQA